MDNDFSENTSTTSERADFDGLWKDAIKRFLPQLIERTLPALYRDVDFSREPEFLSKELRDSIQRPIADEHNSPLFVDELIKFSSKTAELNGFCCTLRFKAATVIFSSA